MPVFRGILQEPACEGCPLKGQRKVPAEGSLTAKIAIVGEGPGEYEEQLGRPFVGKSGRLLEVILQRLGLSRDEVFITNATLCKPRTVQTSELKNCKTCRGKGSTKSAGPCVTCNATGKISVAVSLNEDQVVTEAAQHCRSRLLAEIGIVRPRVVVPLGRHALAAMIGKNVSIMDHRGAVHIAEVADTGLTEDEARMAAAIATVRMSGGEA